MPNFKGYKEIYLERFQEKAGIRVKTNEFIADQFGCNRGTLIGEYYYKETYSSYTFDGLGMPSCGYFIKFDNGKISNTYINNMHLCQILKIKKLPKNLWGFLVPEYIYFKHQLKYIIGWETLIPKFKDIK